MMARRKAWRDIETYAHTDKERVSNPPVGLVTPETDRDTGRRIYAHDPHLDPQFSWAAKAEHTSFEVPTVSLHVHERIDPRTIVEPVRKRNGAQPQMSLFAASGENPPLRQTIEFYRHRHNWTNRLIAGDSLLVMNSLIEKEGLGGQVQTVYLDPPYGIRYGSNFLPFVNRREVIDGRDDDLTGEPEQIRAFRAPGSLAFTPTSLYLRDRLLLARELLHESGSCFVQIGDENVHRVGVVMDEIFGAGKTIHNVWSSQMRKLKPKCVVQTDEKVIQRCILMTTDLGDLIFDPTCGSGTTALVAEQWGRRWITCDTSRVAIAIARQRLMTANFDYYGLVHPYEGVGSSFVFKSAPRVSAATIAYDESPSPITLYDQPKIDHRKARVTGLFTVEAVPAPVVTAVDKIVDNHPDPEAGITADLSIVRTGETLRQSDGRDELLKTGIRGKAGQRISFARLELLPGTRWLHAEGETRPDAAGADHVHESATAYTSTSFVVSFGPNHALLDQRQVARAIEEARSLVPKPKIIVFAAFQFDPEAAKDIDETQWPGVTLLKAQMNADLLTGDLKKKRAGNESFWLIGQLGSGLITRR